MTRPPRKKWHDPYKPVDGAMCRRCGDEVPLVGPDPCFAGRLPGVVGACCGHGESPNGGYVKFENGTAIYFDGSVRMVLRSFNGWA